jgi:hypothetical protein
MLYQLSYGIRLLTSSAVVTVSVQRDSFVIFKKKSLLSKAFRDPAGIRTQDPNIKSVMLYQLSYGIKLSTFSVMLPFPFKVVQI